MVLDRPSAALSLRDYQRAAVDAVHSARARGITRQLVSLPTGAGKTFVSAHLVSEIGLATVFLVHRDELVRQTVSAMNEVNPALTVGVCKADRDELHADIVVASAATLAHENRLERLLDAVGPGGLFISDECHHDPAVSRRRAIERMQPGLLVGLTATPQRGDKIGLDTIYQEIVYHLPIRELVERKHLARPIGLRIETEADLDTVHTVAGDFNKGELESTVDSPARNRAIVNAWLKHAADRTRTVVFCVSVNHAAAVRDAFREAGVTAEMVEGETPVAERQRIFAAFSRGEIQVLTNCQILTEGFDEPRIDCLIMARPTKSQSLYVQCVGRALRWRPDKPDALIIDVVDVTTKHQLVTLPSLSGSELKDGSREREVTEGDRASGQVMDLFDAITHHGQLREREAIMLDLLDDSPFVWQALPDGMWMAPAGQGQWMTLLREGDEYVPVRINAPRGQTPALERLLDRAVAADIAMGIAQDRIPSSALNQREAHWRQRRVTDRQRMAAERWRVPVHAKATAGEVSDLIDMAAFRSAAKKLGLNGRKTG
jgi:superfamily II DNA or RNA helicase